MWLFLQLILFANTADVLLFSARSSLTLIFEKSTEVTKLARDGVASKRSITYAILGLFYKTMAFQPAFHAIAQSQIASFQSNRGYFRDSLFILRNITFRNIIIY